jgi:putative NADH-flavin reductase
MNVVIIGATGGTGRCLTELALRRGHHVTAAVRDPKTFTITHDRLRVVPCDVRDPNAVRTAVGGQELVLCALGGPRSGVTLYSVGARNVVQAMRHQGTRRLVFLSNYGVLGESGRGWVTTTMVLLGRAFLKDTLSDHRLALEIISESGVEWVGVRPMALTHAPGRGKYRVRIDGLPDKGVHIARADVAHFMLRAGETNEFLGKVPAIAY